MSQLRSLPAPTSIKWSSQQVDQRYLGWFRGGPLSLVHCGKKVANHRIEQVIATTHDGYPATAFSYTYDDTGVYLYRTEGTSRTHQYMITSISLPSQLPILDIAANPAAPGESTFEQRFRVNGNDPRFTAEALGQGMRRWLMADPRASYFPIRLEGATVSSWRHNYVFVNVRPLPLELVNPMVDFLAEFARRLLVPPAGARPR